MENEFIWCHWQFDQYGPSRRLSMAFNLKFSRTGANICYRAYGSLHGMEIVEAKERRDLVLCIKSGFVTIQILLNSYPDFIQVNYENKLKGVALDHILAPVRGKILR